MRSFALIFVCLLCACVRGGDILVLTDAGVFITPVVDGIPQPSVPIEQWWTGDVVDQRGGIPVPPGDSLADQVDAWADAENQEYRPLFADMYKQILIEVGSGDITLDDVRTSRVNALQAVIWAKLPAGQWRPFAAHIEDMVRGMNQRGEWQEKGMDTLQSIYRGLSRG